MIRIILTRPLNYPTYGGVSFFIRQFLLNIDTRKFQVFNYHHCLDNLNHIRELDSLDKLRKKLSLFYYFYRFINLARRRKFDIAYANTSMGLWPVFRDAVFIAIAVLFNLKFAVHIHGWNQRHFDLISANLLIKRLFASIYNQVSIIFVLSKDFKDQLEILLDKPIIRIETTFVENEAIQSRPVNASEIHYRIAFMSRLIKAKGVYETVDAFKMARNSVKNLKLVIAGDGPEAEGIKHKIRTERLQDIEMLGFVEGKSKYDALRKSDMFILPTRYGEGLPIVLLEACASGLALITCPVGGIKDVFTDDFYGYLVDSQDPGLIAEKIVYLYRHPQKLIKIRRHNRQKAIDCFSAKTVVKRIEKSFLSLMISQNT